MKYNNEEIKEILEEEKEDKKIKNYINKIKNIFGDDYSLLLLTSDLDIGKSINKYTSMFERMDPIHIESLLFKDAVLSKNNKFHVIFTKKINEDDCCELFLKLENDMLFRKELSREFIKDCDKTNIELFEKNNNESEKERLLHNLNVVKHYERFLRVQKEFKYKKTFRKGNHY